MIHTDITWTDGAWERYQGLRGFNDLRNYFGDRVADEHEAEFLRIFTRVTFAAGPINVQTDGDGFLISTPHIVIGLVWTPDSDETMLRRVSPRGDFTEIGSNWPRTGRWSAHS